jgi:hypothetical protein
MFVAQIPYVEIGSFDFGQADKCDPLVSKASVILKHFVNGQVSRNTGTCRPQ